MSEPTRSRARRRLRRALSAIVGTGLAAGLALAARNVSWTHVLALAARIPLPALVLAAIATVAKALILTTRLWVVFPKGQGSRPSWARVARAFGFGQLTNACVPARAGDVIMVMSMRDQRASSATDATGALLADKALDVVTLGVLGLVLAPALLTSGAASALRFGWVAAVVVLGALTAAVVMRRLRPAVFAKARGVVVATYRSVRGVATPRRVVMGLALAGVAWLAEASSMMLLADPLGVHLSVANAMGTLLVLNLGIAVPLSVGNVGTYEAATVVGLRAFGATVSQGLTIGLLHHVLQIVTIAFFALFFWVRHRLWVRSSSAPALRARASLGAPALDC